MASFDTSCRAHTNCWAKPGNGTPVPRTLPALTRLVLRGKEDIHERGAPSPDEWDAVALTFAEPVLSNDSLKPLEYSKAFVHHRAGGGGGMRRNGTILPAFTPRTVSSF